VPLGRGGGSISGEGNSARQPKTGGDNLSNKLPRGTHDGMRRVRLTGSGLQKLGPGKRSKVVYRKVEAWFTRFGLNSPSEYGRG